MLQLQTLDFHNLRNAGTAIFTLEADISYSPDVSQSLLTEFLSGYDGREVQKFGRRNTDYLVVYHESVNPSDKHFKLSTLNAKNKDQLIELAYSIGIHDVDESMDKLEVFEVLANVTHEDYYEGLYNENSFYNLDYDSHVHGYSQGDTIAIKYVGDFNSKPDNYIKNLFFDTAINGTIKLIHNAEVDLEINFDEYAEDLFVWNKNEFINSVTKYNKDYKYLAVLTDLLEEKLPEDLSQVVY